MITDSTDQIMFQNGPKLLLVDDDPFFGAFVLDIAAELGISVCVARTIPSALACVDTLQVDVAIVDFDLGVGNGLDFAKQRPNVPILLISRSTRSLVGGNGRSAPENIQMAMSKARGPFELLSAACDIFFAEKDKFYFPYQGAS